MVTTADMFFSEAKAAPEPFQQEESFHLYPLRKDLKLFEAPKTGGLGQEWTIQDPCRQLFYRIGWLEFTLLANWKAGMTPEELCELLLRRRNVKASPEVVKKLHDFLLRNELLAVNNEEYTQHLYQLTQKRKIHPLKQALHHYLFIRIPLAAPDRFLEYFLPLVRPLGSSSFLSFILLLGVVGLYLVSRQWDSFWQTFQYFFNASGIFWYGLVITLVKCIHELAHAFTARHFGLRVPTIGVALLVLFPVLYTDVTDAWKLTSRRSRLQIAGAGMMAELALAVIATFLWSFLPEGTFKSAAFLVATVTWVMAAMINFNFVLKFDGYYFLSDLLEVPNLQNRSFALGKWFLRKVLLGLGDSEPEIFPKRKKNFLICYAFFIWAYRAVLFLGIAVMVYFAFFKVLGIFLMIVEVAWFLVRPVWNELKAWHGIREKITLNFSTVTNSLLFIGFLFFLFFPWKGSIERTAYLKPEKVTEIYLPEDGVIRNIPVHEKQRVSKGDMLVSAASHELEQELVQSKSRLRTLQWYLERKEGAKELIGESQLAKQQLLEEKTRLDGLLKRQAALKVTAPFDGIVSNLDISLYPGSSVGETVRILSLYNDESIELLTFLPEEELKRIRIGGKGRFYPNHVESGVYEVEIVEVEESSTQIFSQPWLTSVYGGDVAVRKAEKGSLEAHEAVYRVRLKVTNSEFHQPAFMLRGSVKLDAEPRSIVETLLKGAMFVLIRESSF